MRVSIIPETISAVCQGCNMHTPSAIRFTVSVGTGVEQTIPRCAYCIRKDGEVTLDVPQAPPPKEGPPSRQVKKASQRNERYIATGIGGRTQPGSGSQPGAKGDVRKRGEFRVEAKDTYSNQYILRKLTLDKIRGECGIGEKPALILTFMEKNTFRPRERWAIVPYEHWEESANAPGNDR